MPFDEATWNDSLSYMRTPNNDAAGLLAGETLNPATLHDLCMMYLEKTAYEGITPQQLVTEYFLAKTGILEAVRLETIAATHEAPKSHTPEGHKLEDQISRS